MKQTTKNQLQGIIDNIEVDKEIIENYPKFISDLQVERENYYKMQDEMNNTFTVLKEQHQKWHKNLQDIIKIMNNHFLTYIYENNKYNRSVSKRTAFGGVSLEPNIIPANLSHKYILLLL